MKWIKGDNYYIKCNTTTATFYISKSMVYEKVIYELWDGSKWLYKDDTLEKVKEYAERYNNQ